VLLSTTQIVEAVVPADTVRAIAVMVVLILFIFLSLSVDFLLYKYPTLWGHSPAKKPYKNQGLRDLVECDSKLVVGVIW